jgi:hypothetical protein
MGKTDHIPIGEGIRVYLMSDNCDTDHYMVVEKVKGRLDSNKKRSQKFDMEKFNPKKLKEEEGKENVRNAFTALEDLDAEVDIYSAWEMITANIKISAEEGLGYYELKKQKPWFDEGYTELLDQRKQAKLQWLQDPSEINENNLNNVSREASRYFRNKKRQYLKDKINELATNSKSKNIRDLHRGINEFKRGYQPRINLLKDGNYVLIADSHYILNRWKNYFCQFLNVHNGSDIRQIEVHRAEPLVPGHSRLEDETVLQS